MAALRIRPLVKTSSKARQMQGLIAQGHMTWQQKLVKSAQLPFRANYNVHLRIWVQYSQGTAHRLVLVSGSGHGILLCNSRYNQTKLCFSALKKVIQKISRIQRSVQPNALSMDSIAASTQARERTSFTLSLAGLGLTTCALAITALTALRC